MGPAAVVRSSALRGDERTRSGDMDRMELSILMGLLFVISVLAIVLMYGTLDLGDITTRTFAVVGL